MTTFLATIFTNIMATSSIIGIVDFGEPKLKRRVELVSGLAALVAVGLRVVSVDSQDEMQPRLKVQIQGTKGIGVLGLKLGEFHGVSGSLAETW